jgi:mRNA interferase HicA
LFIIALVKSSEFKRWLADQGATFKPGKGFHLKVTLGGKNSVLPMHSKELGTGLVARLSRNNLGSNRRT